MTTPSEKYQEFLDQAGFQRDAAQQHGLVMLDRLQEQLQPPATGSTGLGRRSTAGAEGINRPRGSIYGVEWGGVKPS